MYIYDVVDRKGKVVLPHVTTETLPIPGDFIDVDGKEFGEVAARVIPLRREDFMGMEQYSDALSTDARTKVVLV